MVGAFATSLLRFSVLLSEDHCWRVYATRGGCLPAAGPIDCVKKTVQWEGLRGLYKASSALLDVMPGGVAVLTHLLPAVPLHLSLLHLSCRVSPPLWLARLYSGQSSLELLARASNILPRIQKATPAS